MFSNEASKKFTGNISLYTFTARYRQKVFLERNIDRALEYNEQQHRRRATQALFPGGDAQKPNGQLPGSPPPTIADRDDALTRRRERMRDIANRLKKEVVITGKSEPILRIDLSLLRGKEDDRRNSQ